MSGKEIFRKVPSVCGYLSARDAEKVGLVTVGMQLVLLKLKEMYYRMETLPYNYEKGCVVEVKELDGDGIPYCYFPSQDTSSYLSLKRLTYPSVYEVVYKDVQQSEKEEVEMKEDQYEWLLENPDKKPTNGLSAEELKVLYDAAYTDDKNVVVDCLDACGIWYRYDTKHAPWADYIHRVKRKITATPLYIPWDLIDNVYNYAAMDKNCNVYFYKSEPFVIGSREDWWPDGGDFTKSPLKHNINGIHWKRSLTKRPS